MRNDRALIRQILSGDEIAFAELVKKYQKQVHVLAWRKIGDFHIAEDITQDVFLKVYQKLHTLKDPNQFSGWLYVVTTNLCNTWLSKNRIHYQASEDIETTMVERDVYSRHITEERVKTSVEAQREVVKRLLAKLKESERTVMTLHYLAEMTVEEISKFLGVSTGTIKSRLQRARNRLQKEETMIREALEYFQISPNLTDNIMQDVARLKPTPSTSKPLVPWALAASSAIIIMLLLGLGSQQLVRFQNPYSLDAQAEMTVELVDAPIVLNLETQPDVRNRLGNANAPGPSDNRGEKPDEVLLAAAQVEGEDVSVSKQQWIQSGPIKGNAVWRLLATPEEELYVLDPLARLYKLHADGRDPKHIVKEWQHIVDARFFKTHWTSRPPIAKWKNTLYILSSNELFASDDNGNTWNFVHSFPGVSNPIPIELILTDHGYYVAFSDRIFRSEDKGKTWKELNDGLEIGIDIVSLVKVQNTLFACTGTHLYRLTTDSWELLQFPGRGIAWFQSVAATKDKLYVAADLHGRGWRIFRSTDLGDSWTDITPTNAWPKEGQKPNITLVAAGDTLLAMERGMVRSTDAGDTWMSPQAPGTSPLMGVTSGIMLAVALNEHVFYVEGWDGLHRSTDGGKSWDKVNITSDIGRGRIDNQIVYKGQNMNPTLYARFEGTFMRVGGEIVKSNDNGKSWNTIQMNIPMTAPSRKWQPSICQIVKSGGVIYAKDENTQGSGDTLLYRVSADGKTFLPIQGMPDIDSISLGEQLLFQKIPAFDPSKIIPIEQWQEHFSGAAQFFKQLILLQQEDQITELRRGGLRGPITVSGDTFYMEYNYKLFRWKRGDTEWSDTEQEETVELTPEIAKKKLKLAVSGDTIYVGKRDGHLVVSFDKGTNWIELTSALPFTVKTYKDIVIVGDTVYVATDAGVAASDRGNNWGVITNTDGTNLNMNILTVDGTTLYGINNTGIYRLESNVWKQVVSDVPDNITSLAVDGNTLYVGTLDRAMLHFTLQE